MDRKEYLKLYHEDYQPKYYNLNKDAILKKRKERIICECGVNIRKGDKYNHSVSKKHLRFNFSKN